MKRVRVILGWLLAGAVINITVAWAVAYWWYAYSGEQSFDFVVSDDVYWHVNRDRGLGTSRVVALRLDGRPPPATPSTGTDGRSRSLAGRAAEAGADDCSKMSRRIGAHRPLTPPFAVFNVRPPSNESRFSKSNNGG